VSQKYLSQKHPDYESKPQPNLENDGGQDEGKPRTRTFSAQQDAWIIHADELAQWAMQRMVVRPDAYLSYYRTTEGDADACKRDRKVTPKLLQSHFAAVQTDGLIGLYTTSPDAKCRWLAIDLDRHPEHSDEVGEQNIRFALYLFETLSGLGFHPLLIDTNGKGGFHLLVFLDQDVPAEQVRAFGRWLVRDWEKLLDDEPEMFPAQDSIGGGYGNAVRLPGLHHTYRHYSRVWDGKQWLDGEDAITAILQTGGDSFDLVPVETLEFQPEPTQTEKRDWWKQYDGDLRTLDMVGLFESRDLSITEIEDRAYGVTCPWADEHTTDDDTAKVLLPDQEEGAFPTFYCFHKHCSERRLRDLLDFFGKAAVNEHCARTYQKDVPTGPEISPAEPLAVAGQFCKLCYDHEGDGTLFHQEGRWMKWDGRIYRETTDDDIRAKLWHWLASCTHKPRSKKGKKKTRVQFSPNKSVVSGVFDALKAVANLSADTEIPCWIGGDDLPQPENLIAFDNGLLDLERTLTSGEPKLLDHTPRWFSTNCLPHRFDPEASCPRWIEFLNQVFEGDEERIRALAQWFGYCLTLDIRQQKLALLIGPPRSGKGTITSVLEKLLGQHNVAYPTFSILGGRFGLATLIDKQAAIVPDAHLGRYLDSVGILERLKSIVGGDPQNVDRKNQSELANVQLRARFTVCVNEMPRLPDASAALRSRLLLIPFHVSFEGKENLNLGEELLSEIEGITNWALDGLRDLRSCGRLLQPKAGRDILDEFVRLSSPIKAFLEDCCIKDRTKTETTSEIQDAWRRWCEDNGHESGSTSSFGTKLRAAIHGLEKRKRRVDGKLTNYYDGICLNDEWKIKVKKPWTE